VVSICTGSTHSISITASTVVCITCSYTLCSVRSINIPPIIVVVDVYIVIVVIVIIASLPSPIHPSVDFKVIITYVTITKPVTTSTVSYITHWLTYGELSKIVIIDVVVIIIVVDVVVVIIVAIVVVIIIVVVIVASLSSSINIGVSYFVPPLTSNTITKVVTNSTSINGTISYTRSNGISVYFPPITSPDIVVIVDVVDVVVVDVVVVVVIDVIIDIVVVVIVVIVVVASFLSTISGESCLHVESASARCTSTIPIAGLTIIYITL